MQVHANADAATSAPTSAWPRRLALATLLVALPLFFFGGSVTTLHAGLAIDGWLVLEPGRGDWLLWAYPIEQWFRDVGTFVEHTHRLLASAVALLILGTAIAAQRSGRGAARIVPWIAVLGVALQAVLGGARVLEKSDQLAFLHGALGQAVFALIGASVIATSRGWNALRPAGLADGAALRRWTTATVAAVYAQIFVGAWLRHTGSVTALGLHLVLIAAVLVCVLRTAKELGTAAEEAPAEAAGTLRRVRRGLVGALVLQLVLGLAAFLAVYVFVGRDPQTVTQSLFPTFHVIGGALFLFASVASAMWSRRLAGAAGASRPEPAPRLPREPGPSLGGAR